MMNWKKLLLVPVCGAEDLLHGVLRALALVVGLDHLVHAHKCSLQRVEAETRRKTAFKKHLKAVLRIRIRYH